MHSPPQLLIAIRIELSPQPLHRCVSCVRWYRFVWMKRIAAQNCHLLDVTSPSSSDNAPVRRSPPPLLHIPTLTRGGRVWRRGGGHCRHRNTATLIPRPQLLPSPPHLLQSRHPTGRSLILTRRPTTTRHPIHIAMSSEQGYN